MKKNNSNSQTNSDRAGKPGKARGPVQRDVKEVMAELVVRLRQTLEPRSAVATAREGRQQDLPGPNRDRLTVGVDLGDQMHCGLGRGDVDGGRAAHDARRLCGIVPVIGRGPSGDGSGDALGLGGM